MGDTSRPSDQLAPGNTSLKRISTLVDNVAVESNSKEQTQQQGDVSGVAEDVAKPPSQPNVARTESHRPKLVAVKTDFDLVGRRRICCTWCCGPKNLLPSRTESAIEAIRIWNTKHCKNVAGFLHLLSTVTKNAEETLEGLRPLMSKLSFQDADTPVPQKESIVGAYLWLLTYGMNHIPMSPTTLSEEDQILHPNPRLNTRLMETHAAYEEIGELTQEFALESSEFLRRVDDLRQNGSQLVTVLQGRFQFKQNPFLLVPKVRPPEVKPKTIDAKKTTTELKLSKPPATAPQPKSILKRATARSRSMSPRRSRTHSITADQHADLSRSPVVILVQATPESNWEVFSVLEIPEKVELIAMFIQEALRLLSSCLKTFKKSITPTDVLEQPGSDRPSSILELTCGLLKFTGSTRFRKLKFEKPEIARLLETTQKFWITIDDLCETSRKLSKVVTETKTIVQCCYVYTDTIYNWNLKQLDIEPVVKSVDEDKRIRKFMTQAAETSTTVDVSKLYILADFMSSGYQVTLQKNSVSSHGISLKLESWEDHQNEPWGLVDNLVDRRSKAGSVKLVNKSRNFIISYHRSF